MCSSPLSFSTETMQQSEEGCLGSVHLCRAVSSSTQMDMLACTSLFEIVCIYRVMHRDPNAILWVPHKPFTDRHGGYPRFSVVIARDLVQMMQELLKASATLMMVSTEQFSPGERRLQTGWLFRFGIERGGWKFLSPK